MSEKVLNEMETSNMPDKEFKVMIMKILTGLQKRVEKLIIQVVAGIIILSCSPLLHPHYAHAYLAVNPLNWNTTNSFPDLSSSCQAQAPLPKAFRLLQFVSLSPFSFPPRNLHSGI